MKTTYFIFITFSLLVISCYSSVIRNPELRDQIYFGSDLDGKEYSGEMMIKILLQRVEEYYNHFNQDKDDTVKYTANWKKIVSEYNWNKKEEIVSPSIIDRADVNGDGEIYFSEAKFCIEIMIGMIKKNKRLNKLFNKK